VGAADVDGEDSALGHGSNASTFAKRADDPDRHLPVRSGFDDDVFAATTDALRGVVVEPAAGLATEPAGLDVLAQ
jgi:hypothetical protein